MFRPDALVFFRAKVEVSTRAIHFIAAHKPSLAVARSRYLPPEVVVWLPVGRPLMRRPAELLLKEAIHIQGTPARECLNKGGRKGIPRCWTAALKLSEGAANWQPNCNFRR